jgi:hypothetical protein
MKKLVPQTLRFLSVPAFILLVTYHATGLSGCKGSNDSTGGVGTKGVISISTPLKYKDCVLVSFSSTDTQPNKGPKLIQPFRVMVERDIEKNAKIVVNLEVVNDSAKAK